MINISKIFSLPVSDSGGGVKLAVGGAVMGRGASRSIGNKLKA